MSCVDYLDKFCKGCFSILAWNYNMNRGYVK